MNIQGVTPFLPVNDLEAMVAFFRDGLGFECWVRYDDFAYVHREGVGFRLLRESGPWRPATAYLDVEDVNALYAEFRTKLGEALANNPDGPRDRTYGQREFTVKAPEGHVLFFGQKIFRDGPGWDRAEAERSV